MKSFPFPDPPDPTKARGRKYTVTTEKLGTALTTPVIGYWLYQPSVILASPLTNNQFVLLINRNQYNGAPQFGEAIYRYTSSSPINFANEYLILSNTWVDNICDMIDARPIWDGSQWHVYVQAVEGDYRTATGCGGNTLNNIYEARGPSLDPPNVLEWVKWPGTNSAKPIISGTPGFDGIGEDMQWFNPSGYGLSGYPHMVTYNDWGFNGQGNDGRLFNRISQDDSTYSPGYGPVDSPYLSLPGYSDFGFTYPDGILLGSLDFARRGNPGIGFSSVCYEGPPADHKYQYAKWIGFFNNPSNVPSTSPTIGWAFAGALESWSEDGFGPRMFRPKVARNEYGYIAPETYHGYPRTWVTYLYYTYTQIEETAGFDCHQYSAWDNVLQSIGVSRLTITERSGQH